MKRACCTIITPDYLHYALALHQSINDNSNEEFDFYILISEYKKNTNISNNYNARIKYLFIDDLCNEFIGKEIFEKYFHTYIDAFRWSMKSVLLLELIKKGYQKALFLDVDLFFFNNIEPLYQLLDNNRFLITPHWRSSDPNKDPVNFQLLFTNGLYNAGFVGVNSSAREILKWWAKACLYKCEINTSIGNYVDQTYLNLIPVKFSGVKIIRDQGCNIANWNQIDCQRTIQNNGNILINNEYPVRFIHFTKSTIKGILSGEDKYLLPYLIRYKDILEEYKTGFDITKKHMLDIQIKNSKNRNNIVKAISRLKRIIKN